MGRKSRAAFFTLALLSFSACENRSLSPPDTLTTVVTNPVQSLNPLFGTDAASQHINELTHSALISINDQLVPEPYLAEEMKLVDPLTLEFRLRAGCKFFSGRDLTTDDVIRSVAYFQDPQNKSAFAEAFRTIARVEKIDALRFRLKLRQISPGLTTDLDLLKIMDLDGAVPDTTNIPGAGPYRVIFHDASQILLERWHQPCLPGPPMKKILVKVVRDDLSRFFKLKTGEVDIVLNEMNYRKVGVIEKDPSLSLEIKHGDGIGYSYLGLNLASEKLKDLRVRRALALSFDLPALIHYKSRDMAKIARNLLADQNFYANHAVPIIERNLQEARRLLGEAGYFDGKNQRPRLRLSFKTNTNTISVENARVLTAQAKEAGIDLVHQANDWGIFYNDVKNGNTEVYMLRWVGVTDPRIYFEAFHSGEIGRNNRTRYRNEKVDKLIMDAEGTMSPSQRKRLYDQVQSIIAQDLPYIGLWYGKNVAIYRKNVQNVTLHPAGKWKPLLLMDKQKTQ